MVAVNILFFLGEIVCVSFHIDQEFRFGIQIKDRWEKYTPPTSMSAGIFVGDGTAVKWLGPNLGR